MYLAGELPPAKKGEQGKDNHEDAGEAFHTSTPYSYLGIGNRAAARSRAAPRKRRNIEGNEDFEAERIFIEMDQIVLP